MVMRMSFYFRDEDGMLNWHPPLLLKFILHSFVFISSFIIVKLKCTWIRLTSTLNTCKYLITLDHTSGHELLVKHFAYCLSFELLTEE